MSDPLITNDAVVLGILISILAFIFKTCHSENFFWKKFYSVVPSLLLCYFIPSIFNSLGIISGKDSNLYYVASRYLLPSSLVLLTISIDLKEIIRLGPKALIMFFAATTGIIAGGPLAIFFVSQFFPSLIGSIDSDVVWRGLATVAGSWIGGGANQAAMKEIFSVSDIIFSSMVTVDVIVANIWMAFLLYGAGLSPKIDKWFASNSASIEKLRHKMDNFRLGITKTPNLPDVFILLAVGFGVTGLAHQISDLIVPYIKSTLPSLEKFSFTSNFFWIIVSATTIAVLLSFTNLRNLEGVGASRYGSVFLYILVATIGMKMNIFSIFNNPGLFIVGLVWIIFHAILMILIAKLIKAPFFFLAVGSQANIGGAASAPIIASAFHPSLAPVGVLLAVLGYAVGTYGAWLCGILMQAVVQ